MCRTDLSSPEKTLVAPAEENQAEEEDENSLENMGESSSKLDALLHILDGIHPDFSMIMVSYTN